MRRDEAIGVVLDDRHMEPPRDGGDSRAPRLGNGKRRRVLQSRIEIDRLGRVAARIMKCFGIDAVGIHRQADEVDTELRGYRARPGIGDRLGQHGFAGFASRLKMPTSAGWAPGVTKMRSCAGTSARRPSQAEAASLSAGEPPKP